MVDISIHLFFICVLIILYWMVGYRVRKLKYFIAVVILFITIGFAAINYTLSIDGDTELTGDLSDFKVYYSEIKVNGVDSPESIICDTELYVFGVIDTVDYDITNSSKFFDADQDELYWCP